MRSLLRLLNKYSFVLVFLLLETLAIILLSNHNHYQHSKILKTNQEFTGRVFNKIDGAREYLSLKKTNEVLVRENATLRNKLSAPEYIDSVPSQTDSQRLYYYAPARIVHGSVYKQFNYLTINKGSTIIFCFINI